MLFGWVAPTARGIHRSASGKKHIFAGGTAEKTRKRKKGDGDMKNNGYSGKIANTGSQRVEAPAKKEAPTRKGQVRYTGTDLRTGTGGKKDK